MLAHDASREKLGRELTRTGAAVLLARDGCYAMTALREHAGGIACIVTDTAIRGQISGRALPFWYRFYNPFGPVIYVADDPALEFATVQYSAVVKRIFRASQVIRHITAIEQEVTSAHAADARIAGWTLSA